MVIFGNLCDPTPVEVKWCKCFSLSLSLERSSLYTLRGSIWRLSRSRDLATEKCNATGCLIEFCVQLMDRQVLNRKDGPKRRRHMYRKASLLWVFPLDEGVQLEDG